MDKYAYCYLVGALFNLGPWAFCYVTRKDLRAEMLVMSCVPLFIGLPQEYWLWTRDWWHPPNLTQTRIGFEDALYAVGTGGTLAAVYAVAFKRSVVPGAVAPGRTAAVMPLLLNITLPFALVLGFACHSFLATTIGTGAALLWILPLRPDLIVPAAINTGFGLVMSFACFWLIEWWMPGFVAAIWDLPKLSGILIAGVPIEDLAWYGYTAALFGIYYKYATGTRFERGSTSRSREHEAPARSPAADPRTARTHT